MMGTISAKNTGVCNALRERSLRLYSKARSSSNGNNKGEGRLAKYKEHIQIPLMLTATEALRKEDVGHGYERQSTNPNFTDKEGMLYDQNWPRLISARNKY